jgi:hypothetical protein
VFQVTISTKAEKILYRFCNRTNCADGDAPSPMITIHGSRGAAGWNIDEAGEPIPAWTRSGMREKTSCRAHKRSDFGASAAAMPAAVIDKRAVRFRMRLPY